MAFNNGFSGDHASLQYVLKTLEAKTYDIPGVVTNAGLQVTANGESVFFYTRSKATADVGNAGDSVVYAVKGAKRIDVPLTNRIAIGGIVPYVNFQTVSADVIGDKVIQETMAQANLYNEKLVAAIHSAAEAKTYTKDATAFSALVEAVSDFKKDNKVSGGISPTAVLASPAFFAELLVDAKINLAIVLKDGAVASDKVRRLDIPGLPCPVIECADAGTGVEFYILNAEGVAAPVVAKSLVITDATPVGYPGGTLIAGELPFGFKIVTKSDDLTLDSSIGYLVAKFSEATQ